MSRKSYPNVNAANQYARDVVRGKIVACQFVIQACQRHLDDLMAEKSKSFRYRFDKDLAERAAKFIQLLPHTKGEWAFKRMPITLEPWQLFVICCAFGWVNKGTRLRRFREVYTEIPRKNGKSAISAGVALYCFACDNEFGAEVYSGATTEKQAWEVFRPARLMCKRTPMLTEAFGIEVNASNMNRPEDGARFEPLIGNPGDGSSPHCAVVDEYHEHATDALYTTMLTGMGARRQPLMWAITTAGYNIEGPCYDKRREVIEMLNGSVPNDELFGIIYTVDEGDDWTDPQVLEKANPNIGVSVYREFLLSQQQRAKNNARLANVFKTKHLNIWVSARSAYFNLVSWQSCEDKSLTLEQFEGQPCILAFDLARKLDMNSMARLYTREIDGKTHYYSVAPRFWVPKLNSSWEPVYQVTFPDGSTDVLTQEDIWHVRTLTLDGLVGLNPIAYAREAISLAAATEEHGARLFSNGAVTSGVLRTEQTLSDQAYERLKKDFEERHTGLGNAHRPMILEMGLDWKSMALNAEDSQFLETRKFQLEEICRLFRVPLHMVQNTDRATFNNIEELGLGFINYSLVPYLTRIEQRINTGLVRKSKQGVYYAKFNAGALLRGDMKSRFEAYATGINWGIYSPNDCRDLEDMNPRPGGDVYLTPMNMTTKPSDGSKAGKQKDNANADETTS